MNAVSSTAAGATVVAISSGASGTLAGWDT